MKAHRIMDDEDSTRVIARVHPAAQEKVNFVLTQPTTGSNGRSEWVWVRLPNGDLILGVFPQGDTYFSVEDDSCYPYDKEV